MKVAIYRHYELHEFTISFRTISARLRGNLSDAFLSPSMIYANAICLLKYILDVSSVYSDMNVLINVLHFRPEWQMLKNS